MAKRCGLAAEEVEGLLEQISAASSRDLESVIALLVPSLEAVFEASFVEIRRAEEHPDLARALRTRLKPLRLSARGRRREDEPLIERVRAALDLEATSIVLPLRVGGALAAMVCIGSKRSGDVFTPTDTALLASVSHHASEELEA